MRVYGSGLVGLWLDGSEAARGHAFGHPQVEVGGARGARIGEHADAARKWTAAVRVLADPSAAGATYLDLRVPERVAAGSLGPIEPEPEQAIPADPEAPVESGATLNP